MKFKIVDRNFRAPPVAEAGTAYLIRDNWNDWGKYQTQFGLVVYDGAGKRLEPGSVKIGEVGLRPGPIIEIGKRAPNLADEFDALDDQHFSIGQDDNYYEVLNQLGEGLRVGVLEALRDCAYTLSIFEQFSNEDVMGESLLRSLSSTQVQTKLNRLAHGNVALTKFDFDYTLPDGGGDPPPTINFHVEPHSEPPTNVHVLIGRNGVGKTRCITNLALSLLTDAGEGEDFGKITLPRFNLNQWAFSGVVFASFSAFDSFILPEDQKPGMRGAVIGLPEATPEEAQSEPDLQLRDMLARTFYTSLGTCRSEPRKKRLLTAIHTLENDPLFAEANIGSLLELSDETWRPQAVAIFERLSSGHAIVLLIITRLVQLVDERTIVLIDEPEGHLHPPLLSAFIRALSDLLIARNGAALLATHSPVVLQEVPKNCVWLLRRSGRDSVVERPAVETFGENVGSLTREVFGLEVTSTGFHALIRRAVNEGNRNYEEVLLHFQHQLGAEAQGIVRNYIAIREKERRDQI